LQKLCKITIKIAPAKQLQKLRKIGMMTASVIAKVVQNNNKK
jgi:hypothetical protein